MNELYLNSTCVTYCNFGILKPCPIYKLYEVVKWKLNYYRALDYLGIPS